MSGHFPNSSRTLPAQPDLRHLKDQAKDLLKAGQASSLSAAQFQVAREYGFPSWPKLKAHVESLQSVGQLKAAIDGNDLERVKELMTKSPELHRAPLGYGKDGPLTWVAECRVSREPPGEERLKMAAWMIENGSDLHQGGDGPLMRSALSDTRLRMTQLLVELGANVNSLWHGTYPILFAPCETLAPQTLKWLIEHGANPHVVAEDGSNAVSMLVGTYARNARGRSACLEVLAGAGIELLDTPAMALHRGRIDLLEAHLSRDPGILLQRFELDEIYRFQSNVQPCAGLTATPVAGGTLLHLAFEYGDLDVARWLIERGADVNARSAVDAEGFGGQTPLFHAVVTIGGSDNSAARLLLESGADLRIRATFRKQLVDMGDPEKEKMREFHNVTAMEYAAQYQEQDWVNRAAVEAIAARGGVQ